MAPYKLHVDFATDDVAPLATLYAGEFGSVTAVETSGTLSVSSGALEAVGASVWHVTGFYHTQGIVRAAGTCFLIQKSHPSASQWMCGFFTSASIDYTNREERHVFYASSLNLSVYSNEIIAALTYVDFEFLVILRATGCFLAIKGGTFTDWTLLYIETTGSTATLYAGLSVYDGTHSVEYTKITDAAFYTPTPTFQDGFTDTNGTALTSHTPTADAVEESGGASGSWSYLFGTAEIQSNKLTGSAAGNCYCNHSGSTAEGVLVAFVNTGTGRPEVFNRLVDINNLYMVDLNLSNFIRLYRRSGGTWYTLATDATFVWAGSTDHTIVWTTDGDDHIVIVDGTYRVAGSHSDFNTATKVGLRITNAWTCDGVAHFPRTLSDVPAFPAAPPVLADDVDIATTVSDDVDMATTVADDAHLQTGA